jgi:hypothetical protein
MDLLQLAGEPTGGGSLALESGTDPLEIGLIGVVTVQRRGPRMPDRRSPPGQAR